MSRAHAISPMPPHSGGRAHDNPRNHLQSPPNQSAQVADRREPSDSLVDLDISKTMGPSDLARRKPESPVSPSLRPSFVTHQQPGRHESPHPMAPRTPPKTTKRKVARPTSKQTSDDDDDLELSSCSSSDDEPPSKTASGAFGATVASSGSSNPSPRNVGRRQSEVTHNLLANAAEQQQRLRAAGSDGAIQPTPALLGRGMPLERDRGERASSSTLNPTSRSGSIQSMLSNLPRSATNSTPSYITQPIKRQSIADIRRSLSFAPSPNNANSSITDVPVSFSPSNARSNSLTTPNGTALPSTIQDDTRLGNAKVRKFVAEVMDANNTFRKETGLGMHGKMESRKSIGDASFDQVRQARDALVQCKKQATADLYVAARHGPLVVDLPEIKKTVIQLFDDLVKEEDRNGNAELMKAILTCIASIDFPTIIIVRQLHVGVCAEGSPRYLEMFLAFPRVSESLTVSQITQLLQVAAAHPVHRVDLLASVFRYAPYCPAGAASLADMQHIYQELFEQAVSLAKAGPMEDRSHRTELIMEAIRSDGLINFGTKDGGDKQTIFSRAAREGDLELVLEIINRQLVDDVNRVQPDGTNALQQAAARGHLKVVEVLLKLSLIGPSLTYEYPGRGNALMLANNAKVKNPELIHVLERRYIELRLISPETSPRSPTLMGARSPSMLNLDRRQSKAQMARKKSFAAGAEQPEVLQVINGAVDGTNVVKVLLTAIKPVYEQMTYELSFDPVGDELRKLGILKVDLLKAKEVMYNKLSKLEPGAFIDIRKEEVRSDVLDLMDKMIEETSKTAGNVPLFELLLQRMCRTYDFLDIATSHKWFSAAAHNGSTEYVAQLMELEGVQEFNLQGFTTKEMFEAAASSSIYRTDSLLQLFSFTEKLNIDYFHAILRPIWQQALEDIASLQRARPQEARANRMQLITLLLENPLVQAAPEKLDDERHSIFSRACAEGDAPLVYYLLNPTGGSSGTGFIKQPNLICAESRTPLMHAAFNGHASVVDVFIQLASARPEGADLLKFKLQMQGGTAADVAAKRGHSKIVDALAKAGVKPQTA